RAHRPDDPRRIADDEAYPPFHDAMMMVDGEVARALAELARERWRNATGRRLQPADGRDDPWPEHVQPSVRDVQVAISRTAPPSEERELVYEIEKLYVDLIARARNYIYIENQYFTSHRIGAALAERLAAPECPEIVIVLRLLSHGWLEELTMQNLR